MEEDLSAFGDKEYIDWMDRTGWTGWEELRDKAVPQWLRQLIRRFRREHHTYFVNGRTFVYKVRMVDSGIYPEVFRTLRK